MKQYVINDGGELSYDKPAKGQPYVSLPNADDLPGHHYWRVIWPAFSLADLHASVTEPTPPRYFVYERVVLDDDSRIEPMWEWAMAEYD